MSVVCWCLLGLLLCFFVKPAHSDDKTAAGDAFVLFTQACMQDPGNPDSTRAWAASHHLAVVTNPRGLQIFAGGPGGSAWQILDRSTPLVLAIRATTNICAVFAERADPAALTTRFEQLIAALPAGSGPPQRLPDRTKAGTFGVRTMKVVLDQAPKQKLLTFMLMTDERPGGVFQVTIQVGGHQPDRP
jgi:hypothetical protein